MLFRPGFFLFAGWIGVCGAATLGDASAQGGHDAKVATVPRKSNPAIRRNPANIRLDVKVVLVPVNVTDAWNRPITALTKESFRVSEDGVEQAISPLTLQEAPVS